MKNMKCLFTPSIKKFCKAAPDIRKCHPLDPVKLAKTCVECAGFSGSRLEFWEAVHQTSLNISRLRTQEDISNAQECAMEEIGTWMKN